MARLNKNGAGYFRRHLSAKSRVLLINPPVEERRYHWIKWNQPLDLLLLSAWLKREHHGIDVRLFDCMLPDTTGSVKKHKVKETWRTDDQEHLWHFGERYEDVEKAFAGCVRERWLPDCIVITSLTSYWHCSIEKLLNRMCMQLGRKRRTKTSLVLYGNYPRFEPEHAARQPDADVALTQSVDATGLAPDFALYSKAVGRLPNFFALNIEDERVEDHLEHCWDLYTRSYKPKGLGISKVSAMTVAFFNEDICGRNSQLSKVASWCEKHPGRLHVEGIVGLLPKSLSTSRLETMKAANVRSLFVEHARLPGGGLDESAYEPLREMLAQEFADRRTGTGERWLHGSVTAFVHIGLPDDDLDELVRSTLLLNKYFKAIILKPFGYSPDFDQDDAATRRQRWPDPEMSSAQRFPYSGNGSELTKDDYANLVRWQNVINRRVKGTTFDFLDGGTVSRLVRETLALESWRAREQ